MSRKTRNDTGFWYCQFNPSVSYAVIDENGNETGEIIPDYVSAVSMFANVSPATGQAQTELFGNLESYDKVIVVKDMDCPINEQTVLFLEKEPEYVSVSTHIIVEGNALYADDAVGNVTYQLPKNDYIVKRVAKSLNSISIAVRKVDVG